MGRSPLGAMRRTVAIAAVVLLLVLAPGGATAMAPGVAGIGVSTLGPSPAGAPLPACRHDDILTRFHQPSEWRRTLLDSIYRVPRSYEPARLMSVQRAGFGGAHRVHASVVTDLRALRRAARAAGQSLGINSAHRTMKQQRQVFRSWEARVGYDEALEYAARPGHSEHHLGTAVDFSTGYRWLRRNAWRYGFVQTFPKGMRRETCYNHERWHYRYIGRAAAADVREEGVTLRRYLWEHHETAP